MGGAAPADYVPPIYDYDHAGTEHGPDFGGNVVTGGYVYRGPDPNLQGQYFFADEGANRVWEMNPTTKVVTNMLAFIHLIAAGEALMLCAKAGVDLRSAFEAIAASSGNSFVHETESQVILNDSYDIGFTMDLACKDAGFALQLGRRFGVPLRLAGLMEEIFREGRAKYGGAAWSSMIVKLLEDSVGTALRAPGFPERLGPEHS